MVFYACVQSFVIDKDLEITNVYCKLRILPALNNSNTNKIVCMSCYPAQQLQIFWIQSEGSSIRQEL
jgi:hypothetical protein